MFLLLNTIIYSFYYYEHFRLFIYWINEYTILLIRLAINFISSIIHIVIIQKILFSNPKLFELNLFINKNYSLLLFSKFIIFIFFIFYKINCVIWFIHWSNEEYKILIFLLVFLLVIRDINKKIFLKYNTLNSIHVFAI